MGAESRIRRQIVGYSGWVSGNSARPAASGVMLRSNRASGRDLVGKRPPREPNAAGIKARGSSGLALK